VKLLETEGRCLVRFDPGEIVPAALVELAGAQGWRTASLSGLGAVRNVVLAYYDLQLRQYLKFTVDGIVELVSLTGNLSYVDSVPIWHLHAAVADRTGALKGGHVVSLEVAITLECWIHPADRTITRRLDERSGLNLLDL
jgi:predicted DNA-binding protein with PD1-like motif